MEGETSHERPPDRHRDGDQLFSLDAAWLLRPPARPTGSAARGGDRLVGYPTTARKDVGCKNDTNIGCSCPVWCATRSVCFQVVPFENARSLSLMLQQRIQLCWWCLIFHIDFNVLCYIRSQCVMFLFTTGWISSVHILLEGRGKTEERHLFHATIGLLLPYGATIELSNTNTVASLGYCLRTGKVTNHPPEVMVWTRRVPDQCCSVSTPTHKVPLSKSPETRTAPLRAVALMGQM